MIVRLNENADLSGFMYNVYGAEGIQVRMRTDDEYGIELKFDFCKLAHDFVGCYEEGFACLSGEIVIKAEEFGIDSIVAETMRERIEFEKMLNTCFREKHPEMELGWKRDPYPLWVKACTWLDR